MRRSVTALLTIIAVLTGSEAAAQVSSETAIAIVVRPDQSDANALVRSVQLVLQDPSTGQEVFKEHNGGQRWHFEIPTKFVTANMYQSLSEYTLAVRTSWQAYGALGDVTTRFTLHAEKNYGLAAGELVGTTLYAAGVAGVGVDKGLQSLKGGLSMTSSDYLLLGIGLAGLITGASLLQNKPFKMFHPHYEFQQRITNIKDGKGEVTLEPVDSW